MTEEMKTYVRDFIPRCGVQVDDKQKLKIEALLEDKDNKIKSYSVLKQQLRAILKP